MSIISDCHELWRQRRRALNPRLECCPSSREWLAKVERAPHQRRLHHPFPRHWWSLEGRFCTPLARRHRVILLKKKTPALFPSQWESRVSTTLLLGHPPTSAPAVPPKSWTHWQHCGIHLHQQNATRPLLPVIRTSRR